jgi:3-hydroxy acid dehydrogenase / malonic semialdehyde reductase
LREGKLIVTNISGKTVFVTGASSGIGQATAQAFAAAGAKLILAARRVERLHELAKKFSNPCHIIKLDVRERRSVEAAIAAIPEPFKEIDILVNNAGLARGLEKAQEADVDAWEEMVDTNVKGLLYVTRAVLPGMVSRKQGHIVNIGSIAGHEVYPMGSVYCGSKFAVDAITRGIRMDLIGTGVRVSTVDPGMVETEFSQVRFRGDNERAGKVYQGLTPLTGADIADTIMWVVSRPAHIQVAEVIILPTDQASCTVVNRRT